MVQSQTKNVWNAIPGNKCAAQAKDTLESCRKLKIRPFAKTVPSKVIILLGACFYCSLIYTG